MLIISDIDLISFDVTSVSFLRGSNTGERDVTRMAYTTPEPHGRTDHRLPSPTAEPDPDYCYMNTLYTMHNTQSQLPVNGNDVVTSIATIGTFEAFLNETCTTVLDDFQYAQLAT